MLHSGGPIDLSFWKKSGEIVHLRNCIALPNNAAARYSGTQNFKVLSSGQFSCKRAQSRACSSYAECSRKCAYEIRKIRLVCIFRINGLEVFL